MDGLRRLFPGGAHATDRQPSLAVAVLEQEVGIELRHDASQALVAGQAVHPQVSWRPGRAQPEWLSTPKPS